MKSVIFDLDGTLADTSADLIAAANACFDAPMLDPVSDAATAFGGGRAMLSLGYERLGVQPAEDARLADYHKLLDHYGANICVHTRLYDAVVPALVALADRGYALGICTNKPEGLAVELVKQLGITDHFKALLGADTLPIRKPDPEHLFETIRQVGGDLKQSVLIGDTITDRKTSANAGLPSVLVTFGPTGRKTAEMKPEGLLDHFDQLPDLVDHLLG